MQSRKRRRDEPPTIHPRNKYSEKPPDFNLLASIYPSFHPFVFSSRSGRPTIDWTDFNATRELTRVLLHHDHGVNWWIPDGQLCPTVPNRSNYIHWIGDLLSLDIILKKDGGQGNKVRGFDIGTGANCIYPLLGASLYGWSFVGSDVTEVALEWAKKNVESNPHLLELIEIRNAAEKILSTEIVSSSEEVTPTKVKGSEELTTGEVKDPVGAEEGETVDSHSNGNRYHGQQVLVGVVRDGEEFDFCMCNPPFFEHMEEAGHNPRTACGGTHEEMVCPGGEQAFITRIIEDSVTLKHSFRWFSSMVGRKANLKFLASKLRDIGVSVVKTTEFVQGQTARWGLAWSFMSPNKRPALLHGPAKSHHSFTLEGLQRKFGAFHVLKAAESFFLASGASCLSDLSSFLINVDISSEQIGNMLKDGLHSGSAINQAFNGSAGLQSECVSDRLCFRVSVFEQIPGTVLVKGSLQQKESPLSGFFSSLFNKLEDSLGKEFVKKSNR